MFQRLLAAHPAVASTAEPWLLLPFLYSLKPTGVKADYGHRWMVKGLRDFCAELPNGEADYWSEIRETVLRLYTKAAGPDATYFLDKTPPYHHVASEVIELFPDAKFVFLWRNPLAVIASTIETWSGGRWNLDTYRSALETGLKLLVDAYSKHRDRVVSVRYEDLVAEPERELGRVFDYLQLEYDASVLSRFADVVFPGRLGDPTGVHRYKRVSTESLERWRQTLRNPLRKWWARRYLREVGRKRLAVIGYDVDELLAELDAVPSSPRLLASDSVRHLYGAPYSAAKDMVLGTKFQRWDVRPPSKTSR